MCVHRAPQTGVKYPGRYTLQTRQIAAGATIATLRGQLVEETQAKELTAVIHYNYEGGAQCGDPSPPTIHKGPKAVTPPHLLFTRGPRR